jgi:hypothetical protein
MVSFGGRLTTVAGILLLGAVLFSNCSNPTPEGSGQSGQQGQSGRSGEPGTAPPLMADITPVVSVKG